jgi:leader peptidase (prepilin peptidase)/N-methyltransferase
VASLIDWDLKIIPDGSTLPAMAVGMLGGPIGYVHLVPVWFQSPLFAGAFNDLLPKAWQLPPLPGGIPLWVAAHPHWHGLAVSVCGLLVGGGLVWGVRIVGSWVLRREAMGFGDVVLLAMIGSFLGWQAAVMVFFAAPLFALVTVLISLFAGGQREIPYGPYLSLAALFHLLFFRQVWPFWERMFQSGLLVPLMFVVGGILLAVSLGVMQLVKKALGIPLYSDQDEWYEDWTPADQLGYQYSENHDRFQGRWRQTEWPGVAAGQGTRPYQTWRHGGR